MADENTVLEAPKGTGKLVAAGQVSSFKANPLPNLEGGESQQQPENTATTENAIVDAGLNKDGAKPESAVVTETPEEIAAKAKLAETPNEQPKTLSDEELKAEYEKRFPPTAVLTDEDKQKQELAFEKRMLDLYVDGGGKIEEFALLKQVASTDLTELSKAELTKELKAAGFNETEIAAIQKERYFQLDEAELEQMEDETAKEFAKRKAEYGKNKLEGKGQLIKENAVDFLNNLKEAVNQKDFFTQKESEFVSNVDAHFEKLERKLELQLGKVDDTDIPPVAYDFPETVIAEAKELLRNPTSRKELLFNVKDGSINLESIAALVVKAKAFDSAVKTGYLEGQTRQVEEFKKIFPFVDAKSVGVGGSPQSNKPKGTGQIVSAGQPQRFQPQKR